MATYMCLDCMKSMHRLECVSFINVDFDHTWAEHYPVTLQEWETVCA